MSLHDTPLTEPVLLILTSLADEPKHGYAILKDVAELSGERVQLSTGTLYGALRRLLEDGWITRHEGRGERDRQSYRLSGSGRAVLEGEIDRMRSLARIARSRLAAAEGGAR